MWLMSTSGLLTGWLVVGKCSALWPGSEIGNFGGQPTLLVIGALLVISSSAFSLWLAGDYLKTLRVSY